MAAISAASASPGCTDMANAPIYIGGQELIGPGPTPNPTIGAPNLPNRVGEAVSELGTSLATFAAKVQAAREETSEALARSDYLAGLDKLQQQYQQSTDWATAPKTFAEERSRLEGEILARDGFTDQGRAKLRLYMTQHGISASRAVDGAARTRMVQSAVAANDAEQLDTLRVAASAVTPAERDAAVTAYEQNTAALAARGVISAPEAVARTKKLRYSLDSARAMQIIRADPVGAQKVLEDPSILPHLDPVSREGYRTSAANAADQVRIDQAAELARTDPVKAREMVDAAGLQPHNRFRALSAIDTAVRQHEADRRQAATVAASTARAADPLVDVIKQGGDVDPVRIQTVLAAQDAAAARGDQAAAKYAGDLREQMALQPYVRAAWGMSPTDLDTTVQQMRAELTAPGANPTVQQFRALDAFEAVAREQAERRNKEPVLLGSQTGARYYRIAPVDLPAAAAGDERAVAALTARGVQAEMAHRSFGGSGSPFTAEEQAAFKQRFDDAGPDERYRMLRALARSLPARVYEGAVGAVAGDAYANPLIAGMLRERPAVAEQVVRGMAILATEKNVAEKASAVRLELQGLVGGQIFISPDQQQAAVSAALALDAARRASRGALYDATDTSGLRQAWEDVAGPMVWRNGMRAPVTPGITTAQFHRALDALTDADLRRLGGATDRRGPVDATTVAAYGVVRPVGPGSSRYFLGLRDPASPDGFAPLFTAGERPAPLVVDLRDLLDRPPAAPPTAYQSGRAAFRASQAERLRAAREGGP